MAISTPIGDTRPIPRTSEVISTTGPVVAAPTGNRNDLIRRLYKSIGQKPDPAGLAYWLGRTDLDDAQLNAQFRGAVGLPPVEFDQPATDFQQRRDYVETLYREELGRNPDAAGLDFWTTGEGAQYEGMDLIRRFRDAAGLDNTLYQDPAYAAFMRTMRQREGTIEADRAARARELANQRTIAQAAFDRQEQRGLRQVDNAAEARGMYRSGGRIRNRAQLAGDIAVGRAEQELNYSNQQNELNRRAAAELADLSRQRDEQEIATRNTLTRNSIDEVARG